MKQSWSCQFDTRSTQELSVTQMERDSSRCFHHETVTNVQISICLLSYSTKSNRLNPLWRTKAFIGY